MLTIAFSTYRMKLLENGRRATRSTMSPTYTRKIVTVCAVPLFTNPAKMRREQGVGRNLYPIDIISWCCNDKV